MDSSPLLRQLLAGLETPELGELELFLAECETTTVTLRERKVESLVGSFSRGLGARALKDGKLAFTHTADLSPSGIAQVRRTLADFLAAAEPDEHNQLAPPQGLEPVELDLSDRCGLTAGELEQQARAMAEAALAVEEVERVEAVASAQRSRRWILNTLGMERAHEGTVFSLIVEAHARRGELRETAHSFSSSRHLSGLYPPVRIGTEAAEWARSLLGGRPLPSGESTVVFAPEAAGMLLGYLGSALDGDWVNLGATYLVGKLGESIASALVSIVDDPLRPRGLRSTLWDGEGVPTQRKCVVRAGVLQSYFHNLHSAHRAGVASTGNASRAGYSSPPAIGGFNFFIENGTTPREVLTAEVGEGLLVHRLLGHGPNLASGLLSTGAVGWRIAGGRIAEPVSQVTLTGNLLDILGAIDGVGDDLDTARPYSSPSLRVRALSISGT